MSSRIPKPGSAGSNRSKSVTTADASGAANNLNTSGVMGGGGIPFTPAEAAAVQHDPAPMFPADIPLMQEAVSSEEARAYLEEFVSPTLAQGLRALCMIRPSNPVDYLALYLLRANPNVTPDQRGVVEVSTNLDDIAPIPQAED